VGVGLETADRCGPVAVPLAAAVAAVCEPPLARDVLAPNGQPSKTAVSPATMARLRICSSSRSGRVSLPFQDVAWNRRRNVGSASGPASPSRTGKMGRRLASSWGRRMRDASVVAPTSIPSGCVQTSTDFSSHGEYRARSISAERTAMGLNSLDLAAITVTQ